MPLQVLNRAGLRWETVSSTLAKVKSYKHLMATAKSEGAEKSAILASYGAESFSCSAFLIPGLEATLETEARPADRRSHFELLDKLGRPHLIAANSPSAESTRELRRLHAALARVMVFSKLGAPVEGTTLQVQPESSVETTLEGSGYGSDEFGSSSSSHSSRSTGAAIGGPGIFAVSFATKEPAPALDGAASSDDGDHGGSKKPQAGGGGLCGPALKIDPYGYDENHPSFYQPPPISFFAAAADVRERISASQGPPSVQGQSVTKATGEFIRWQGGLLRGMLDASQNDAMDVGAKYWSTMPQSSAGQRKARLVQGLAYPPDPLPDEN